MAFRIATVNWFGRGVAWGATPTGPVVQSATVNASYPPANLYDGQTSPVCRWASLAADYSLDTSLNLVPDGDAEQATVPSSWTATGGTLTRSAAVAAYKGAFHFALTPTGVPDVTVPAGAYLQLRAATQGNTRTARFQVLDMERGGAYYLAADGTWTATPTWLGSTAAGAWTNTTVTELRAPTFATWGRIAGTLRIVLCNLGNGASTAAVYFDEILLYPSKLDVVALVGHNLPPTSRLRLQSFADYWHGGATTTEWDDATGRFFQPTGWKLDTATTITQPYLRVLLSLPSGGTAYRYPQAAELVLGRTISLPRTVRPDWPIDLTDEQPRSRTRGGLWAQPDLAYPRRKFPLDFDLDQAADATEWDVLRDEMALATGMGSSPCLLLPATTAEATWCLFGHLRESMQMTRHPTHREVSWEFEELGVPIVA
jgi:hypothetical protein